MHMKEHILFRIYSNRLIWFLCLRYINLSGLFSIKAILVEERWYYLTYSWDDKEVYVFPKGICPKVIVKVWLVFEFVYLKAPFEHFSNYVTVTIILRNGDK